MIKINSYKELAEGIEGKAKAWLLLFKKGNEKSDCAFSNVQNAGSNVKDIVLFTADVNIVADIHPLYDVTSVPALLEFENGILKNVIKGCHDSSNYLVLFEETFSIAEIKSEGKPVKRVTVYSTPTCSWCNTLKAYLKQHNIRYSDIDVSRDQRAADELIKRSGQRGVPQTDINGEIIVGFNKPRINELLGIRE